MSRVEIDAELTKGIDSLKSGKTYTADEVDAELANMENNIKSEQ